MVKISVIIPVYGVEKFIERSAKTLLEQTMQDVEFIFVNDATKDKSIKILSTLIEKYPARQSSVRIVNHEVNKGLPAARNTGLSYATGEYIFHCDSDDFVELDMLESMYNEAKKNDADIVWSDYYLSFEKSEKYMKQPSFNTSIDALKGMLIGTMKYNVWNKLVRRKLYEDNHILFPEGYSMGEDMTMMKLFLYASNVAYLPHSYYHYYQGNTNSITSVYTEKHLKALYHNATDILHYLKDKSETNLDVEIACLKLLMKWTFLLDGKRSSFKLWQEWFPEANEYIDKSIGICKRIKFIEKSAAKGQYWIIWLHYWFVCRFYYKIKYCNN